MMSYKRTQLSIFGGLVAIILLNACGPSQADLDPTATQVTIPACVEGGTDDTTMFNDLVDLLTQNLLETDSYRYRTIYRYMVEDGYAEDDLSIEVVGAHSSLPASPDDVFIYPSQTYERSNVVLTDLQTISGTELIIIEDGLWLRSKDKPGWMAFDSATSADMFNLVDMFSPPLVLSFMINGGGGTLLPGVRAAEPTMAQAETLDGREVMHRCWLLPEVDDGINAYLIHYESVYTFLNNAEIHLWTAEDDTQLVRLALTGEHVGERLGEYEGVTHDTPSDFLLWMEMSDLNKPIDISPPAREEIALTISTGLEPGETVSAPFNELPLPEDAELVGVFGESESMIKVSREYSWPYYDVHYGVIGYYSGSGWYEISEDRLPLYQTEMNLSDVVSFYLDQMSSLGWSLQNTFLQGGWPVMYLIFERDGAILPIILTSGVPGVTQIAAVLPPPDDILEAVLTGWESYTTQNSDLHDDSIEAIAFDAEGRAWIGTRIGLSVFNGEAWTYFTAEDLDLSSEDPEYSVSAMTVDQDGRLWVGTRDDLSVYDGQTWETFTPGISEWAFLPRSMTVDSNGRVWLALGYSESVGMFDGNTFTYYYPGEDGMPAGHAIDGIATDQQDRIWIGTSGGGVYVFDGNTWATIQKAKSPPNETNTTYAIEDLTIDDQGWVWIASGEGLSVFDGERWTTYNTENSGIADDWVRSLGIDQYNRVWVATTGGRLNVLDTSGEWMDYTPVSSDISLWFPEAMTIDPQGRIWVGSDDGVSVFTPPTP